MPRLNAQKNPPSRVVTRQPNRLTRNPDACPEKKIIAIESEPTQAKRRQANVTFKTTQIGQVQRGLVQMMIKRSFSLTRLRDERKYASAKKIYSSKG